MDKVIDGVDVSGCEFAVKVINDNRIKCHCAKGLLQIAKMQEQPESIKSGLCENNPNCYYKQLQRLQVENERLKANKGRCAFKCLDNTFCPEADKKITELELSRDSYKVSYETAKKYREKAEKALQEIKEDLETQSYCECSECGNDEYDKKKKKYTVAEIIDATQGQYGNETFKEFFNG